EAGQVGQVPGPVHTPELVLGGRARRQGRAPLGQARVAQGVTHGLDALGPLRVLVGRPVRGEDFVQDVSDAHSQNLAPSAAWAGRGSAGARAQSRSLLRERPMSWEMALRAGRSWYSTWN